MRILLVGGASFIGSHLAESLLRDGHRVSILDDFSSGREENLMSFRTDVEVFTGSAKHEELLRRALSGQEALFQLAAKHGGRGYIESHELDCFSNIDLDRSVFLEAARADVEKIVYASSACVYPVHLQEEPCRLRESDVSWESPGGALADGAYGWAKLLGEMQLEAVKKEFDLSGISTRIFTAYGERENLTHALPALVAKALLRQDPYQIWGSGQQRRNFTYVADTVEGLRRALLVASPYEEGERAVNIGLEDDFSVDDLAEEIFDLLAWRPEKVEHVSSAPVGVSFRASDNTLSRELLGWEPGVALEEGLRHTLSYLEEEDRSKWAIELT